MERYEYLDTISSGAYGVVYRVLDTVTGQYCAAKGIKSAHEDAEVLRLTLREVRTLKSLPRHANVVQLVEAFRSHSGRVYLIFEHVERSLLQEMDRHPGGFLPGPMLKSVAWQLLHALAHCHDHKIMHRDVKPANVLLTGYTPGVGSGGVVKLCDFGFARPVPGTAGGGTGGTGGNGSTGVTNTSGSKGDRLSSCVMTRWYRPPEVLVGDTYGPAVDVWSYGCTLAELALGRPLFPGRSAVDQLWRIMRCLGPLPPGQAACVIRDERLRPLWGATPRVQTPLRQRLLCLDARLFDLIAACLTMDPAGRPTVHQLLQMPYFWDVRALIAGTDLVTQLPYASDTGDTTDGPADSRTAATTTAAVRPQSIAAVAAVKAETSSPAAIPLPTGTVAATLHAEHEGKRSTKAARYEPDAAVPSAPDRTLCNVVAPSTAAASSAAAATCTATGCMPDAVATADEFAVAVGVQECGTQGDVAQYAIAAAKPAAAAPGAAFVATGDSNPTAHVTGTRLETQLPYGASTAAGGTRSPAHKGPSSGAAVVSAAASVTVKPVPTVGAAVTVTTAFTSGAVAAPLATGCSPPSRTIAISCLDTELPCIGSPAGAPGLSGFLSLGARLPHRRGPPLPRGVQLLSSCTGTIVTHGSPAASSAGGGLHGGDAICCNSVLLLHGAGEGPSRTAPFEHLYDTGCAAPHSQPNGASSASSHAHLYTPVPQLSAFADASPRLSSVQPQAQLTATGVCHVTAGEDVGTCSGGGPGDHRSHRLWHGTWGPSGAFAHTLRWLGLQLPGVPDRSALDGGAGHPNGETRSNVDASVAETVAAAGAASVAPSQIGISGCSSFLAASAAFHAAHVPSHFGHLTQPHNSEVDAGSIGGGSPVPSSCATPPGASPYAADPCCQPSAVATAAAAAMSGSSACAFGLEDSPCVAGPVAVSAALLADDIAANSSAGFAVASRPMGRSPVSSWRALLHLKHTQDDSPTKAQTQIHPPIQSYQHQLHQQQRQQQQHHSCHLPRPQLPPGRFSLRQSQLQRVMAVPEEQPSIYPSSSGTQAEPTAMAAAAGAGTSSSCLPPVDSTAPLPNARRLILSRRNQSTGGDSSTARSWAGSPRILRPPTGTVVVIPAAAAAAECMRAPAAGALAVSLPIAASADGHTQEDPMSVFTASAATTAAAAEALTRGGGGSANSYVGPAGQESHAVRRISVVAAADLTAYNNTANRSRAPMPSAPLDPGAAAATGADLSSVPVGRRATAPAPLEGAASRSALHARPQSHRARPGSGSNSRSAVRPTPAQLESHRSCSGGDLVQPQPQRHMGAQPSCFLSPRAALRCIVSSFRRRAASGRRSQHGKGAAAVTGRSVASSAATGSECGTQRSSARILRGSSSLVDEVTGGDTRDAPNARDGSALLDACVSTADITVGGGGAVAVGGGTRFSQALSTGLYGGSYGSLPCTKESTGSSFLATVNGSGDGLAAAAAAALAAAGLDSTDAATKEGSVSALAAARSAANAGRGRGRAFPAGPSTGTLTAQASGTCKSGGGWAVVAAAGTAGVSEREQGPDVALLAGNGRMLRTEGANTGMVAAASAAGADISGVRSSDEGGSGSGRQRWLRTLRQWLRQL